MKRAINPTGRLDVLILRVADAIAASQCPNEWPHIRPMIEQAARKTQRKYGKTIKGLLS